jgi:hypothetical protein
VPYPHIAVIGALLLQTVAFIIISGKSVADGIVLTGITFLLIGSLSADHPMIREAYFGEIRPWILTIGVVTVITGILLVIKLSYRNS